MKEQRCIQKRTYPQAMHPRLRRISIQFPAVWIPRETIHDCPAEGTRLGKLESQIIMRASYRVIVLMDHKMVAVRVLIAQVEIYPVGDG